MKSLQGLIISAKFAFPYLHMYMGAYNRKKKGKKIKHTKEFVPKLHLFAFLHFLSMHLFHASQFLLSPEKIYKREKVYIFFTPPRANAEQTSNTLNTLITYPVEAS